MNSGRDAYIAHLTGAKAVQVGSALMKEGAGALGRIDRELDGLLAEHGKGSVDGDSGPGALRGLAGLWLVPCARCQRVNSRHQRVGGKTWIPRATCSVSYGSDSFGGRSRTQGAAASASASSPRRLARPRTPAFHVGNTGSNPVGDTN